MRPFGELCEGEGGLKRGVGVTGGDDEERDPAFNPRDDLVVGLASSVVMNGDRGIVECEVS